MLDLDSGFRLQRTDDADVVETLRADVQHYRRLYHSAFALACELQVLLTRQREQIAELHEERERMARTAFGPQGEQP